MHMVEAFLADRRRAARGGLARARAAHRGAADGREAARATSGACRSTSTATGSPSPTTTRTSPRDPFRPYGVTPGHGLEWSRLLCHLHASLVEPPAWLLEPAARGLFARAVADGWDAARGGFAYTTALDGRPVVEDRFHWVCCEAIATAAALHDVTGGEAGYARWFATACAYADQRFVDREHGSLAARARSRRAAVDAAPGSGKPDVYHALQATLLPGLPPLAPRAAPGRSGSAPGGRRLVGPVTVL